MDNNFIHIQEYLETHDFVSPKELQCVLNRSRVTIHTLLKKMTEEGILIKKGSSPHVSYSLKEYATNTLEGITQKTTAILSKYPIVYAGIFGSVARGEENPESDIDILMDYRRPFSLISMVGLERELSEALGKKVDLVTEAGLSPYIKSNILKDLKVFYGSR